MGDHPQNAGLADERIEELAKEMRWCGKPITEMTREELMKVIVIQQQQMLRATRLGRETLRLVGLAAGRRR